MLQITAPQATIIVAAITIVGGLIGWFGRGVTFLVNRWWTGAPKQEQAAYLSVVADLVAKLKANGMTLEEVRQFEMIMRKPGLANRIAATTVVETIQEDSSTYVPFLSNVAMKARTGAEYGVAEAHLEKALVDLRLMLSDQESEALGRIDIQCIQSMTAARNAKPVKWMVRRS